MKHEELTRKIIGCCMKVHSTLGSGFQEVIYQRALVVELEKQGLGFAREMEMDIFYEGVHIGKRRVDFFVEDKNGRAKSREYAERCPLSPGDTLLRSVSFTSWTASEFRSQKPRIQTSV